jgi:hypothetical protein
MKIIFKKKYFILLDFDNDHEILLVHFHQLLDLNPNNLMEFDNGDFEEHSMLMMTYDMNRKMNAFFIMIFYKDISTDIV